MKLRMTRSALPWGDSCAKYAVKDTLEVFTKETIREKLRAFDDSL